MIDDAWVSELERRAKPLRVALPPWGEVLAREALRAPPREPAPARGRWKIAALALAAGACAVWAWPRRIPPSDPLPTIVDAREDMTVAVPIVVAPPTPVAPPPAADPIEEALARTPEPPPPREPRRSRRASRPRAPKEVAPTVDCILDPRLCHPAKTAAPPHDELPETLGTAEIKRGIDGIRAQTHLCARVHDAAPKQRVKVKFSIAGATGTVTMAIVLEAELPAGLKQCLVKAVLSGSFPRFRKESLGVVFPLALP